MNPMRLPAIAKDVATPPATTPLTSRRRFLGMGGAGLLSVAAAGPAMAAKGTPGLFSPASFSRLSIARRTRGALRVRNLAALKQSKVRVHSPALNGDESFFANALSSYTKGLPHDDTGIVDPAAWAAFIRAMESGDDADFDRIPKGGTAKQANPQAAFAYDLIGADCHALAMPAPPAFSSAEMAGEMVELYAHALLRDVPFDRFATDPGVPAALAGLNALSDFRGPRSGGDVTAGTLFRGITPGDLEGNYISQFLLQPVPYGAHTLHQTYRVPAAGDDHITDAANWLNILRGGAPATAVSYDSTARYIATGRDLGEFVHRDFTYQAFLNAALILLGNGVPAQATNPYRSSANQGAFVTFGGAEVLARVADISQSALKAAWFQKWRVHRRLRPEVFAGRIHELLTGGASYPIHRDVLDSSITGAIHGNHGTWFLPMAYPEGSPTHPAYPAGHAVIAGACATVLKAFFDGSVTIASPVAVNPESNGTELMPVTASLTVEGEINKLANNIAIGRNIAGVHWRSDGHEGLLLGEAVAVAALKDWKLTYHQKPGTTSFRSFRGTTIEL